MPRERFHLLKAGKAGKERSMPFKYEIWLMTMSHGAFAVERELRSCKEAANLNYHWRQYAHDDPNILDVWVETKPLGVRERLA